MSAFPEDQTAARTNARSRSQPNANSRQEERTTPTYGYHNTFHTHATPPPDGLPPAYTIANAPKTLAWLNGQAQAEAAALNDPLPAYSCSVETEGILGLKQELSSPFQVAGNREWSEAYVVLQGTQLSLHRVKSPHVLSKKRIPGPGKLLKTFSLQHAEVGVASDFKKTALIPRSPFAHLVPASARQKLFETDPHLFEPLREHVIRLRLETEQFLLCAATQDQMLDWIEQLCAAIDISTPLDDRSEPRYRSLPRRSRRQRLLEGSRVNANLDTLSDMDAGRRIIAEQERIIRQLYPHLAGPENAAQLEATDQALSNPTADAEGDDLDPEDARFPTPVSRTASRDGPLTRTTSLDRPSSSSTEASADPKSSPPYRHSPSQALRYRRRCAPVLLASSPRVSDVVFSGGQRMRIHVKEHVLIEYTSHPPRYDAHNFPKPGKMRPAALGKANAHPERPASPIRGNSDASFTSSLNEPFNYDLSTTLSEQASDEISSVPSSEPPSPTAATHAKADAARRLVSLGKKRSSEEGARDSGLSAVALGVGLLI
ncbi:hypothetical protein BDV96DRAFT_604536 [Lophiotrema nucula]|uniref:PH domain-containing protein n=1 Tax=Lophiotrema nucula TaxID=690887 RepID=A0A6A5YR79_9PLEO|nr:hypothetical protein BDV96DRAFT_604536 [Lophiotrema nucula]